jgi:hypothetical protein
MKFRRSRLRKLWKQAIKRFTQWLHRGKEVVARNSGGVLLTQEDRLRARQAVEFVRELEMHKRLRDRADARQGEQSWLNSRYRNRY